MATPLLASDLNNPDFVGPQNPDALLHVEFYWHEPLDQWKSFEAGKPVRMTRHVLDKNGKATDTGEPLRVPYIRIMRPGDTTSVWETPVREDHKQRWPQQWMYWQMKEGLVEGDMNIPGWKLQDWPYLQGKQEQVRELNFLRFYVVEQLAQASDSQIQKLGIGGMGLREQARNDLRAKLVSERQEAESAKDKELRAMREQIEEMKKTIAELATIKPVEQKKRGRPRKGEEQLGEVNQNG